MRNFKNVVLIFLILQLLFSWQSIGNTQQVSRPVTYSAEFKPFGEGIDWDYKFPNDFDELYLHFKFLLSPGTVEAALAGDILFNQNSQQLQVEPRQVFDDEDDRSNALFSGRIRSTGGLILKGEIVVDFVLSTPLFGDIHVNIVKPIPNFPQIDRGWDEEKYFNSFLFGSESVQLDIDEQRLITLELSGVELTAKIAEYFAAGATGGISLLSKPVVKLVVKIIKDNMDAGLRFHGDLVTRLNLSGEQITLNGSSITSEGQSVQASGFNPNLDSYSIDSSYEERFTVALDLIASTNAYFDFQPFGVTVWSYEKRLHEIPIPIVPEIELDALDFTTTPDTITFPVSKSDDTSTNRAPTAQGTISSQSLQVGNAYTEIGVANRFRDPDGDTLTYTVRSNDSSVVRAQKSGSSRIRITPVGEGRTTVTVIASDGSLSATQTFSVTVTSSTPISNSPDLFIQSISATPTTVYTDKRFKVSVTVKNRGGGRGHKARLYYYYSSDAIYSTDDTEVDDDYVGTLYTNETNDEYEYLSAPTEEGDYYVIARVDSAPNEQNTSNNYAAVKITVVSPGPPDLVVSLSANKSIVDGNESIKLSATVHNYGQEEASDSTTLRYYLSTDATYSSDDTEVGTDGVRRLRENRSDDESINLRAPDNSGQYYYFACVDAVDNEGNTDNNCSNPVSINVRGPDLSVDSVRVDYLSQTHTAVAPNGNFKLYTTVRNQGTDSSPSTNVRYTISRDAIFSTDDTEVQQNRLSSLGVGASIEIQSQEIRAPYTTGVFYCFVCVDSLDGEGNTDNNCSDPIRITVRNVAPQARGTIPAQTGKVGVSTSLDVTNYFADANNDTLTYSAVSSSGNIATVSVSGSQVMLIPTRVGNGTITVTASDGSLTATQNFTVSVVDPNRAPTAVGKISAQSLTVGSSAETVNVSANFNDLDNDDLTYTARSSATSVATVSMSGAVLTIRPVATGSTTITVTASDGMLTTTQIFAVTVLAPVEEEPVEEGDIVEEGDPATPEATWMPDSNLRAVVRIALGLQEEEVLTPKIMTKLTALSADSKNISNLISLGHATGLISNLMGLEHATNLTQLILRGNHQISDITPVQNLTKLTELNLGGILIGDITPLQNLTKLTKLRLYGNQIGDITPLQNLTKLIELYIGGNQISDITPLQNLTKLTKLSLDNNQIGDISPVQNLTELTELYLWSNQISDITPLQNLTKLIKLYIGINQIGDITPLQNLTELTELYLWSNQISDITPLQNLTKLTKLLLDSNQISDVGPLEGLTALTKIFLLNNPITDYAPLRRLKAKNPNLSIDITIPAETTTNNAPVAVGTISAQTLTVGGSAVQVDVSSNFSDPDNDTLTYTASSGNTNVVTVSVSGSQVSITPVGTGSTAITVKASDGSLIVRQLISVSVSVTATPVVNSAPVAVGTISAQTLTVGGSAVQVDVSSNFSDPDNDTLTYTASSSATTVATVSVSGSQVTITPVAAGSTTITVTASDGGLTATQTISLTVNAAVTGINPPLSDRTQQVRDAIVAAVSDVDSADDVTAAHLAAITSLDLSSKSITSLKSGDFNGLTGLTTLKMESNSISDISPLSGLTSLLNLNLIDNSISDISALSRLTSLTVLWLSENSISDISALSGLTSLIYLGLGLNSISDISALSGLTSLTNLGLTGNSISDISALSGLTSLTFLNLSGNSISDISALDDLTALTQLFLSDNSLSDISALSGLTSLTGLYMSNSSLSDISALSGLTSLKRLILSDNSINDISALDDLTALTYLAMRRNSISDISALDDLTALTELLLNNNSISDISALSGLTSLKRLNLRGNPISNYGPLRTLKATIEAANSGIYIYIDISLDNNIPVFTEGDSTTRTIAENTASGVNIGSAVSATDEDNHTLTYRLSGTDAESFSIVSSSGQLQTSAALDYETKTSYTVIVTVYDGNSGGDTITVTINVTDDPNAAPAVQVIPTKTELLSNYPNPFNPETWIPYQLAKPADVSLTIYNVKGTVVRELSLGYRAAGVYYSRSRAAHWDGRNNIGEKVATGLYFVKFKAGDYTATRKMLIRK